MNKENLRPLNIVTKSEQREITRKGGIASGKARKAKKELAERFALGIELFAKKKIKELKDKGLLDEAKGLDAMGLEVYSMLRIATDLSVSESLQLQAWNDICDRTNGKPAQKSIVDATITQTEVSSQEEEMIDRFLKSEAKKSQDE